MWSLPPGSGKTYEVVSQVILTALRTGRRVVANIAGLHYEEMRAYLLVDEYLAEKQIGSPTLLKRQLRSVVSLSGSEAALLGGLSESSVTNASQGVPFLPRFFVATPVSVPVRETCQVDPVPEPVWAVDQVPLGASAFDISKAILAEVEQRRDYENQLKAAAKKCE